jgi:hypothetical protein
VEALIPRRLLAPRLRLRPATAAVSGRSAARRPGRRLACHACCACAPAALRDERASASSASSASSSGLELGDPRSELRDLLVTRLARLLRLGQLRRQAVARVARRAVRLRHARVHEPPQDGLLAQRPVGALEPRQLDLEHARLEHLLRRAPPPAAPLRLRLDLRLDLRLPPAQLLLLRGAARRELPLELLDEQPRAAELSLGSLVLAQKLRGVLSAEEGHR